jgi:hypothetical protein
MSPVKNTPMKSSRWCNGEDDPERRKANPVGNGRGQNNRNCVYHHGGVGGRGMPGQIVRLKVEVCDGGPRGPSERTSVPDVRRAYALAEVGAARSSNEGGNDAGAKGPCLNTGNETARDESMAPKGDKNGKKSPSAASEAYGAKRRGTILARVMRRSVLGKPDAVDPLVRFDEGWGTQGCSQLLRPLPTLPFVRIGA